MKLYVRYWYDCIRNRHFVLINAKTKKEADQLFEKYQEENSLDLTSYTSGELNIKEGECVYLNKVL